MGKSLALYILSPSLFRKAEIEPDVGSAQQRELEKWLQIDLDQEIILLCQMTEYDHIQSISHLIGILCLLNIFGQLLLKMMGIWRCKNILTPFTQTLEQSKHSYSSRSKAVCLSYYSDVPVRSTILSPLDMSDWKKWIRLLSMMSHNSLC